MPTLFRKIFSGTMIGLPQPSNYLHELESLRGWAILLVVIFHYAGMIGASYLWPLNQSATLQALSFAGNTGVSLFFVLSGFLLTRPFLQRLTNDQPLQIGRFFLARALRILPLYLIVVVSAWIVTGNPACMKAMAFIPIGFQVFPFSVPWWSLSTEIQFYIVLPLLIYALSFRRLRFVVLIALFASLIIYAYLLQTTNLLEEFRFLKNSLPDRASAFVGGGVAAWIVAKRGEKRLAPVATSFLLLVSLGSLIVLLHWYGKTGQRQAMIELPLFHYLEAALWSVVLFSLIQPRCMLKNAICNPLFDWFGRISYSIYLLHVPIIFYMVHPSLTATKAATVPSFHLPVAAILSFVTILVASAASYRYIERPFLAFKSRRIAYKQPRTTNTEKNAPALKPPSNR
jgi:peptidoglycan/LPS O-acetylase OafA/YrhL